MKINESRVKIISSSMKPLREVIVGLKYRDPQYTAIRELIEIHGLSKASILVVLNGLVSYQLTTSGEVYWLNFAKYSKRIKEISVDAFREILLNTGNTRSLDHKINRVKKILTSRFIKTLSENPLIHCDKLDVFARELGRVIGVEWYSKTILFTTKMYNYLCSAMNRDYSMYIPLPIPVDYRNSLLALTSCIVESCHGRDIEECAKILTSGVYSKIVQEAWGLVCREINISCLVLDNFTWLFTGICIRARYNPHKTIDLFKRELGLDIPLDTASVLLECVEEKAPDL